MDSMLLGNGGASVGNPFVILRSLCLRTLSKERPETNPAEDQNRRIGRNGIKGGTGVRGR